jgi:hypothetical protein
MAIRNPYATVDWSGSQVPGLSHAHGADKNDLEAMVADGYRCLGFSNYRPSDPSRAYPLTNMTGVTEADVAADVIGIPNAEIFGFADANGLESGFGSMLITGADDTGDIETDVGYNGPWRSFVDEWTAELLYANAGGISLNHPHLSFAGVPMAKQWLDYSPYVLGIEIFNHLGDWFYDGRGWALDIWHELLVTGRRCYGFGAPDHTDVEGAPETRHGSNRLLVPSAYATMTRSQREQACLEAYYNGQWYVAIAGTSPELAGVAVDGSSVSVEFAESCDIKFVYALPGDAAARESATTTGTSAAYTLRGDEVYVRAVGTGSGTDEISLTQPVMFMDVQGIADFYKRRRQRRFMVLSGS